MRTISLLNKAALIVALSFPIGTAAIAQTAFQSQAMDMKLSGTSNLHDWEMKAVKGSGKAAIFLDPQGNITRLTGLSFTVPAKNLKSKHKVMDNNTYKALKADSNPNISFVLISATVTATGNNSYRFNCIGKMTIAGTTRETNLVATGKYNAHGKNFIVTGVKDMKMTDYNVTPPTALMGTITTGDAISIAYNLQFNQ